MKTNLIILSISLFSLISCFSSSSDQNSKPVNSENNSENYTENDNYKYEYRTGTSGNYEYNYDVEGTDEYGNSIYGNVNTSGKYGSGYIETADGSEIEVETEWKDWGIMEATDENGNTYEMNVE